MTRPKKTRKKATCVALPIDQAPKEPDWDALAKGGLNPACAAALTTQYYGNIPDTTLDLSALIKELSGQCSTVNRGDLARPEAMLTAQAHTLDAIFNKLAKRAAMKFDTHFDAGDRYLRLALKAQGQCRATLETLATIKSPPMVFARQANISSGPQQVNNGEPSHTRTRKSKSGPNKLLERTDGQRVDPGAAGQAIGRDPAMATVGTLDRPKNKGG